MLQKNKKSSRKKPTFSFPLSYISRLTIGLFFLGFLTGCVGTHFLQNTVYGSVTSLFRSTISQLPWLSISRNEIFLLSFKNNLSYFLILAFFSITNVWRFYYVVSTVYSGFTQGLLFSFCIMTYHIGGILQYFCFLLPQCLVLVPVFLYAIRHLEDLHQNWFGDNCYEKKHSFLTQQKRQLLFRQLPFFFTCIALLLFCAVLEGYLNVPLIKSYNSGLK
ncbi:MAG: stage II sporulation protein M [bacterium]|nr:stage II sporulation protein M [bacterium]